jgi:hypothetical protein
MEAQTQEEGEAAFVWFVFVFLYAGTCGTFTSILKRVVCAGKGTVLALGICSGRAL